MPLNVFYLDDEVDLLKIFSDLFSSDQVIVKTFLDPHEMIQEATDAPPDVAFIDLRMPSLTGDEVARRLPASTYKVLLTGEILPPATPEVGCIISKPMDLAQIEDVLAKIAQVKKTG